MPARPLRSGTIPRREGGITFDGDDISEESVDQISNRGIKLVPEARRIFPTLTVHENMQVARDMSKGREPRPVEEMYEVFPILDELRENRGRNLSGGEQQMLSVARALIQSPDLLLLDEPTEGLAPVIVDDLEEILEEIVSEDVLSEVVEQDVTVLITEQNVDFALDLAERAYIIDKGANAWEGTVDELEQRQDLLDEYLSVGATDAE